jgi:hypothetical protein
MMESMTTELASMGIGFKIFGSSLYVQAMDDKTQAKAVNYIQNNPNVRSFRQISCFPSGMYGDHPTKVDASEVVYQVNL